MPPGVENNEDRDTEGQGRRCQGRAIGEGRGFQLKVELGGPSLTGRKVSSWRCTGPDLLLRRLWGRQTAFGGGVGAGVLLIVTECRPRGLRPSTQVTAVADACPRPSRSGVGGLELIIPSFREPPSSFAVPTPRVAALGVVRRMLQPPIRAVATRGPAQRPTRRGICMPSSRDHNGSTVLGHRAPSERAGAWRSKVFHPGTRRRGSLGDNDQTIHVNLGDVSRKPKLGIGSPIW